ncbi:MAG: carboxypeptidase regulatory-like domain-containing protein [Kofleriaceae bacterium]
MSHSVGTVVQGMGVAFGSSRRARSVITLLALLIAGPAAAEAPRAQRTGDILIDSENVVSTWVGPWLHAWTAAPDDPVPPGDGSPPPVDNAPAPDAPTTPPSGEPRSPSQPGSTVVAGRVTDVRGRPVVNMRVYVLPGRGQSYRTTTDRDGRYAVTVVVPGRYSVVIAIGKAHTFRSVVATQAETTSLDIDIDLDIEGGEVIQIDDEQRPKPKVAPEPKDDQRKALPYSEEAIKRDAWARAWLLLDVDETGKVKRLKMLKRPGFGLEKICLDEAFKLTFEPGRDADGRPMKTYVLWAMEWPSWGWLVQGAGTVTRLPNESKELHVMDRPDTRHTFTRDYGGPKSKISGGPGVQPLATTTAFSHALSQVTCFGSGPLNLDLRNRAYRDCAQPNLAEAVAMTWITRESAPAAIVEMSVQNIKVRNEIPHGARWPAYVGFGVTGTFAVATVLSYFRFVEYQTRLAGFSAHQEIDRAGAFGSAFDGRERWLKLSIISITATVAAGGASLWLWNRHHANFSVAPSLGGYGGSASLEMSW